MIVRKHAAPKFSGENTFILHKNFHNMFYQRRTRRANGQTYSINASMLGFGGLDFA